VIATQLAPDVRRRLFAQSIYRCPAPGRSARNEQGLFRTYRRELDRNMCGVVTVFEQRRHAPDKPLDRYSFAGLFLVDRDSGVFDHFEFGGVALDSVPDRMRQVEAPTPVCFR
jgi:hypothetical protein